VAANKGSAAQLDDDVANHQQTGLQPKKKTKYAQEQNPLKRLQWQAGSYRLDPYKLVFIDESGVELSMTRDYARAPVGQRAYSGVPGRGVERTNLLASLSLDGITSSWLLPGAVDGLAFETYIEHLLSPSLRPGQVIILDNYSIHKGPRVKELIEAQDCKLLFLPPYSPDFSPIENAFSKLKAWLKRAATRTQEALSQAIREALEAITLKDIIGWFKHCGYSAQCL
jgi:transposase